MLTTDILTDLLVVILCWQCNSAIAKFKDDEGRLWNAYEYIRKPPSIFALGREVFGRTGRITNKRKRKKRKTKK